MVAWSQHENFCPLAVHLHKWFSHNQIQRDVENKQLLNAAKTVIIKNSIAIDNYVPTEKETIYNKFTKGEIDSKEEVIKLS